jgi:hypothetical protein
MCSDVENAECKRLACKCKPGLSYHHATRKCLSGTIKIAIIYAHPSVNGHLIGKNRNNLTFCHNCV